MAHEGTDGGMSIDAGQSIRNSTGHSVAVETAHTCQQPTLAGVENNNPDEPGTNEKKRARASTKRAGGPLRGLDMNNVLSPPEAKGTIEISDDEAETKPAGELKHLTRQSRHGRTTANYDMKFHPSMDRVIHPKYAAKRETGSASLTITPGPLSDVETDEESLPSSARDGSESESSAASDEDIPLAREPDPEATRRSSRTSAQKMVNYSTKHHPQDSGLPGYQHKARALREQNKRLGRQSTSSPKLSRSPIDAEPDPEDSGAAGGIEEPHHQMGPPRKKLRVLSDERSTRKPKSRPRTKKVANGKRGSSEAQEISSDQESSSDPVDYSEWAIQQSQLPRSAVKPQVDDPKDSAHSHSDAQSSGAGATQTERAVISTRVVEDSEDDLHDEKGSTTLQSTPDDVREPSRTTIESVSPTGASRETEHSDDAASLKAAPDLIGSYLNDAVMPDTSKRSPMVDLSAVEVPNDGLPPSAQPDTRSSTAALRTSSRTLSSRTASRTSNNDFSKAPVTQESRLDDLDPTGLSIESEFEEQFAITERHAACHEEGDVQQFESRLHFTDALVSEKERSGVPRALLESTSSTPFVGERGVPSVPTKDRLALFHTLQPDLVADADRARGSRPPQLDGNSDSVTLRRSTASEHASLFRADSAAVGSLLREFD